KNHVKNMTKSPGNTNKPNQNTRIQTNPPKQPTKIRTRQRKADAKGVGQRKRRGPNGPRLGNMQS
ncbi:hypothetical protein, partial [Paracoccus seriniphilus]|uniref:hypothetical protein n=1 Tax=Paracoccus seriniphilus TaxID=184748 RepID=UPI00356997C7